MQAWKHGTRYSYLRHLSRDEEPCKECTDANRLYYIEYRARKKAEKNEND